MKGIRTVLPLTLCGHFGGLPGIGLMAGLRDIIIASYVWLIYGADL
jgi:hypothetical protein